MALGELIEDCTGKITGQRVLDVEILKMETSLVMEGNYREFHALMLGLILLY
jgi:hypothetical protein